MLGGLAGNTDHHFRRKIDAGSYDSENALSSCEDTWPSSNSCFSLATVLSCASASNARTAATNASISSCLYGSL